MRQWIILLAILYPCFSFSQDVYNYTDIPCVQIINSLAPPPIKGKFVCDLWFNGAVMNLNATGRFENYYYGCDGREPIDSGSWKMEGGRIALSGTVHISYLDVLQYGEYCVLVPQESKEQFIKEMMVSIEKADRMDLSEYNYHRYVLEQLNVIVYIKKVLNCPVLITRINSGVIRSRFVKI